MIQSREFLDDANRIMTGLDNFINVAFKMLELHSKELSNIDSKQYKNNKNKLYRDAGLNMIGKKIKKKFGSRIPTTNNELKDIMKVIITTNITSREGGYLNFLRPLMAAALALRKSLFTPLVKIALVPFGLSAAMSATVAAIQKKICVSGTTVLKSLTKKLNI